MELIIWLTSWGVRRSAGTLYSILNFREKILMSRFVLISIRRLSITNSFKIVSVEFHSLEWLYEVTSFSVSS